MMKKRFWTALLSVLCVGCASVGAITVARAETSVYDAENVMDIAEYMTTTEFLSEGGFVVDGNNSVVFSRDVKNLLTRSCGISLNTKFASNEWNTESGNFVIALGAHELVCSLTSDNALRIDVYNRLKSEVVSGQYLKAVLLPDFDATKEHDWSLARVYTTVENDNGYALRLYMDDKIVFDLETEGVSYSQSSNYAIKVVNNTGVDVNVRTALDEAIEFEEEKNVLDVLEFSGNPDLFSAKGQEVAFSGIGVHDGVAWSAHNRSTLLADMSYIGNFTSVSNGLKWKMRADKEWETNWDAFRLDIGATDIRIGYDAVTNELFTVTFTKWSEEIEHVQSIGGKETIMENYDPTEWHDWKIARVKAMNADGYAVRFYIDGENCLELYTTGGLTDKNEKGEYNKYASEKYASVHFVNSSRTNVYVKSTYYSRPIILEEKSSDILEYGASMKLLDENGLTLSHGRSAIDYNGNLDSTYATHFYDNSHGLEFQFKSNVEWYAGYSHWDVMKVTLGATDIRFNAKGDNKISIHVYNRAHDYNTWGYEVPLEREFDETQWHTVKITRRKFVSPTGTQNEKGFQIALWLDGEKIIEKIEPNSGMWSWAYRMLSVTNLAGGDMVFKSTLSASDFVFERDKISELSELPDNYEKLYMENAFTGTDVLNTNRIINSVYTEEFSSTTNGASFILTSEEAWQTSGIQKKLTALTEDELATLTVRDGVEIFKQGGNGDYAEVATTGVSGKKYKFEYVDWTSDWATLKTNDYAKYKGEIDPKCWTFPTLYKASGNLYYSADTTDLIMTADWMATKYHIHADFGTITLQFKQTPDNKIVVRAWSKYSYVVLGEDYVRDSNGNPIEFRTGAYTGDVAYEYHGQTLKNGDLYENKFVISKAKAVNGKGFVTRVWVNDCLGLEVYDPNILGGEGKFSHFLIDNISGTTITAYSVAGIEEYRNQAIAELEQFDASNYSQENGERVLMLIEEAKTTLLGLNFIKDITEYKNTTLAQLNAIWTKKTEKEFTETKAAYVSALSDFVSNNSYAVEESEIVQALLNEATNAIQSLTETDGFVKLSAVYTEYYKKISLVETDTAKQTVATAKLNAKTLLESLVSQFSSEDYTSENFAKFTEIQTAYNAKIDAGTDVAEINALPYLAQNEMWAVESKADTELNAKKAAAKSELTSYKNESDYLALDWKTIKSIISQSNADIDDAADSAEVDEIFAKAKARIDAVSQKGSTDMIPDGDTVEDGENNANGNGSSNSGCGSTIGISGAISTLALGIALCLLKKKQKARGENDGR